jgi:hypothetical protein
MGQTASSSDDSDALKSSPSTASTDTDNKILGLLPELNNFWKSLVIEPSANTWEIQTKQTLTHPNTI